MFKTLHYTWQLLLIALLTLLTQIGGVVYLICWPAYNVVNKRVGNKVVRIIIKAAYFSIIYLSVSFVFVPVIANQFGRVPLPICSSNSLKPLNTFNCICNRHYVNKQLYKTITDVADKMQQNYPNTVVNYLDGCFPFFKGYPLLPHRSHNDGKKLDLAFYYTTDGQETNNAPSWIGYGIYEEALPNEVNKPKECEAKGYWQYSALKYIVPQGNKSNYKFDIRRTKSLMNLLIAEKQISRIFIEPHLKQRINLNSNKIGFQGCKSVRHDDHIHFQIE